jgi:hypothetical protein
MLDVHLALLGSQDVVVPLGTDETFQALFLGKTISHPSRCSDVRRPTSVVVPT